MTPTELLKALRGPARIHGAPFGADLLTFSQAITESGRLGIYVARDEKAAIAAQSCLYFFAPNVDVFFLPAWDVLPYDRLSPTPSVSARRCAALARLAQRKPDSGAAICVTTASAMVQKAPPVEILKESSLAITVGERVGADKIVSYLTHNGYSRASTVRDRGEYAIRGGIVDIFPPTEDQPLRLDFFGDTLDALKAFDPETQRSTGTLKSAAFAPVSEILFTEARLAGFRERYLETFGPPSGDTMYEAARAEIRRQGLEHWLSLFYARLDSIFDYAGDEALLALGPLSSESARERIDQTRDYYASRVEAAGDAQAARVLSPGELYLTADDLDALYADRAIAHFSVGDGAVGSVSLDAEPGRSFAPERARPDTNVFDVAVQHVARLQEANKTVLLAAWTEGSADRLQGVLADHGLENTPIVYSLEAARSAGVAIAPLSLETGFTSPDLAIITEPDLLGDRLAAPRRKRKAANFITDAGTLDAGDLVVHVDHGVGRYDGLRTLELAGAAHDCLELTYDGGDRIFLPVENIDLISRYGSEDAESALDRLGGVGWQTRKAKAKRRILEMAEELLSIAAARALRKAEPVDTGQGLYEEFAARFPYEETDDQLNAIEDVLEDLSSGKPMDRLICGDVGFGKTEVALRGAFLAAMGGMQVAVIAPTTLLARQHFKTFESRFSGWPLNVRHLSRLVPGKEASETRAGLASGTVDVVVGTHAVLAKAIDFKRLGLLIIDEEQRFGVKHKERLKELKSDVHVLTLSATPIPRTLQMALTGIRDLSIIATPPVDRLAVRTYVSEFDTVMLREALLKEKYRGGQAFFVAPRIKDLDRLEQFLRDNVPEVSFVVAHGQMGATELEDIMSAFYEGEFDVLLSTTIVESGLDIPRANTLLIYRADLFGLAQLYQLRGRVGRSKLRAYAYLTTPEAQVMTPTAERRLRVLQSLDSLGAGFQLASHDLDIRGGGNLLGDQQSGHIREVGVELYQSMLEDAVSALKAGTADEELIDEWSPQINLGLSVLIPETYVDDLTERLTLYRRLADIDNDEDREAFAAELIDRFGPLPDETRQLFEVTSIKASCKRLGIEKLDAGPKGAVLAFRDDTPLDPQALMTVVRARPSQLKIRPDSKLVLTRAVENARARVEGVKGLLRELETAAKLLA
ncbi:MAG: transcription-repair coupling factor [Pseudomonadota bacterium]